MFRMLLALVIGVPAFLVYISLYTHTVKSVDAQEQRRYEKVNLSPAEIRARDKKRKRREAKLEKIPLKAYGKIDKSQALLRIKTSCRFLVTGWSGGKASTDVCSCIAKGMGKGLTPKQVSFVYAGAKQGDLRMLAGRTTSFDRLRIAYGMSRKSARAVGKRVESITERCTK